MPTARYLHYDVFTSRPFEGNQLAVFPDAQALDGATMQRLTNEMNFAESTFLLPAERPDTDIRMRIFTPAREMPMAGHPTIGTTFALAAQGREFLVKLPLIGRFHVYNTMGALAAADALGLNFREAVQNVAGAPQVPGRLERVIEHACQDTWRNVRDDLKRIQLAQLSSPNGTVWQVTEPTAEAANRLKALKIKPPPAILRLD